MSIGRAVAPMRTLVASLLKRLKFVGVLLVAACAVSAALMLYDQFDDKGLVPHTATVDMYMKGDWLVGENRECVGVQGSPAPHEQRIGTVLCPSDVNVFGDAHNVTVKFWGRVDREGT